MKLKAVLKLLISKDYIVILETDAFLSGEDNLTDQLSRVLDEVRV
jgi:hypothetical protein